MNRYRYTISEAAVSPRNNYILEGNCTSGCRLNIQDFGIVSFHEIAPVLEFRHLDFKE